MARPKLEWTAPMVGALREMRANGVPLFLCAERIGISYATTVHKARELGLAGRMSRGSTPGSQLRNTDLEGGP